MILQQLLFWQPKFDYLRFFGHYKLGRYFVIFFNYAIWVYLFYVSYVLIKYDTNIFWQLLIATIVGEIIEKLGKSHALWRRPLYQRNDATPLGLVDRWYKTGSFPSGHTIKAAYFLLFILQYQVMSPVPYLAVVVPLISLRVLVGFHYPLDVIGGAIFGSIIWWCTKAIAMPEFLTSLVRVIFNFVFRIN